MAMIAPRGNSPAVPDDPNQVATRRPMGVRDNKARSKNEGGEVPGDEPLGRPTKWDLATAPSVAAPDPASSKTPVADGTNIKCQGLGGVVDEKLFKTIKKPQDEGEEITTWLGAYNHASKFTDQFLKVVFTNSINTEVAIDGFEDNSSMEREDLDNMNNGRISLAWGMLTTGRMKGLLRMPWWSELDGILTHYKTSATRSFNALYRCRFLWAPSFIAAMRMFTAFHGGCLMRVKHHIDGPASVLAKCKNKDVHLAIVRAMDRGVVHEEPVVYPVVRTPNPSKFWTCGTYVRGSGWYYALLRYGGGVEYPDEIVNWVMQPMTTMKVECLDKGAGNTKEGEARFARVNYLLDMVSFFPLTKEMHDAMAPDHPNGGKAPDGLTRLVYGINGWLSHMTFGDDFVSRMWMTNVGLYSYKEGKKMLSRVSTFEKAKTSNHIPSPTNWKLRSFQHQASEWQREHHDNAG